MVRIEVDTRLHTKHVCYVDIIKYWIKQVATMPNKLVIRVLTSYRARGRVGSWNYCIILHWMGLEEL